MTNKLRQAVRITVWCMVSFIIGLAAPTACTSTPQITSDRFVSGPSIIYSEDLIWFERMWSREVRRLYPNAIIVMSHGHDKKDDWYCDYGLGDILVKTLVAQLREEYPIRRIVLMICNPGGYILDASNVTYSLENVWMIPDRALTDRSFFDPNAIGNVYEMQSN